MSTNNIVRARVTIRGTRPLIQHAFGPDSIPLEKGERSGVAGNDPLEWKKTMMVTAEGQLYLKAANVFACVRDAAKRTKKGRGSIQPDVAATLQVEEETVLVNRWMPKDGDPPSNVKGPVAAPVYIDVASVRNPATGGRNVRYRIAAAAGWECSFVLRFDKTVVPRDLMRAVLRDASVLTGIGDGRSVGNGRFEVVAFEELTDAEEATAAGSVEEEHPAGGVEKGRKKVRPVREAASANGGAH